jgi:hypothetical protein
MTPDASYIIVSWNTRELTLEALRSVYDTNAGLSFDVVVVDNGSRDGSPDAVKEAFPEVHLIANGTNLGFARAVNQGLTDVAGRYLVLLNSDARLTGDAARVMVDFMDANPDVGIVGGQLVNEDGSKQNVIAAFPSLATELLNKRLLRLLLPGKYPGKERRYDTPVDVDSLVGACMMVRRTAVEDVGPLDEGYFFFMEETDWSFRMQQAGWRVVFLPFVRVVHRQGASAGTVKTQARIEFYRSRYRFFSKHRGTLSTRLLKAGLITRLLLEVVADVFFIGNARYRDRWKSRWQLLRWHLRACPPEGGLRDVDYAATAHQEN